jgi:hypothetical protein
LPSKLDATVGAKILELIRHESFIHQIEFVGFFTFTDMCADDEYVRRKKTYIILYVIAEEPKPRAHQVFSRVYGHDRQMWIWFIALTAFFFCVAHFWRWWDAKLPMQIDEMSEDSFSGSSLMGSLSSIHSLMKKCIYLCSGMIIYEFDNKMLTVAERKTEKEGA